MGGPYFMLPPHMFNGDTHGNCLVCGDGEDGALHIDGIQPWHHRWEIEEPEKKSLPDRILEWLEMIFDWFADLLGAIFDTTVGKWLKIVGIVGFTLFILFCIYMFAVLVIGTFIVGWDVCATGVLPWDIVYTDGGCS